ncbi:putative polyketide synthase [Echria macrotheca]|uniref:Polyketide synthase n=1 Tax=Echria macrotheca TaxID=438768 RepID=A0AAJ0B8Q6_9PEZI|nr:putative polyketide synthase [Echria macrotheca]
MADQQQQPMPIAIVGMSCRLPGDVSNPSEFYRMLCRKRTGWAKVPADRFNAAAYNHPNPDKKGTFNSEGGYFIKGDISMFDAAFFDMTKKEAESMDPAMRLLLETAYEAFENAGISKDAISGKKVGVFVGGNYGEHRVGNLRDLDHIPSFDATGNQAAFLAGRLAYYFNLHGPTFTIDTACSSSMHAVHLAVQSIRAGESEQALVGSSHLITHPDIWVSMGMLRLFSDSGRTHAFDHRAKSGYARGEGAGCVVLKPLHRAQADNDHIFAVIQHTALSHNGRTVGIVAPSPDEQEQLLRDVFAQARISPRDVGFFEAHGTGTKKGDPIEATAIYKAVGSHFTADEPLYIGSTKPNVGHLECASGIISLIKSVLMLYYGFLLPNADFEKANEAIPLQEWNMEVVTEQKPWPSKKKYICVNNFGFSGSNSTCILAAPPVTRGVELGELRGYTTERLFVLSANDETALKSSISKLGIWLEQHAELYQTTMPRNLAYTLCQRRTHHPWRVAIVAGMCSQVAGALNGHDLVPTRASSEPPKLAFVFTGQGAQWHAMGRELLKTHPVFAHAIERCDAALRSLGADFTIIEELTRDKKTTRVGQAHISQAICSAVQLALTDLLESFNIRPSAVTGHSSGEIGAAYAAGALTFESAMAAAYHRGQAIVELKRTHPDLKGSMMAIGMGAEEVAPILKSVNVNKDGPQVVVACENSPSSTTLSGDEEAIDRVAEIFKEKGVFNRKLFVDVAYHSPHMRLVSEFYLKSVSHIEAPKDIGSSSVQFFSSLHGSKTKLSSLGPDYWVDNLTKAVRFNTSLQEMCKHHNPDILIEIGPHAALKGPIMQILKKVGATASKITYLPTLVRDQNATVTTLQLAGQLFVRGYTQLDFYNINHNREEKEQPDLISGMYPYAWTKQKYWFEPRLSRQHRLKPFARHDLLGTLADWSSDLEPTWRNIVRTEDLPWLKEYQVQSRMVFPVAAFMSMTIEAASQHASLKNIEAGRFEIKNLQVTEQLFIEDGLEYEVLLTFRPSKSGDGANEFHISSHESGRGWLEHCTGAVRADAVVQTRPASISHAEPKPERLRPPQGSSQDSSSESSSRSQGPSTATSDVGDGADTPATPECAGQGGDKAAGKKVHAVTGSGDSIYKYLGTLGASYPKAFQSLVEVTANETEVTAHCAVRDTVSEMPMSHETPYKLHPSVLDSMLQLPLLSLGTRGAVGTECAFLPSAIRHFTLRTRWRKRANETFRAHSTVEPRSSSFMVEIFSSPGSEAASISVAGLEFTELKATSAHITEPRELCFKFNWEPARIPRFTSETKTDASKPTAKVVLVVQDGGGGEHSPLVRALCQLIKEHTGAHPEITSLQGIKDWTSRFIVLTEMDQPVLADITPEGLEQIKKLLTTAPGLLWVTRGATRFCVHPEANMALGLIRTARSESSAVAVSLDLDANTLLSPAEQASLVRDAFVMSVLSGKDDVEMEFAEENGKLTVPRIVADNTLNLDVHRTLGASVPYMQDFHQPGRQMQLAPPAPDTTDQLFFEDRNDNPLADDEVEIFLAASTITQDDVAFVQTGASQISISRGCSGTVTRVGRNVRGISVGSRVCALSEGLFGTHARARVTSTAQIPSSLSVETAASVPVAFTAAHYALTEVARVRPGERVLIQLSGPVGIAAGEVARYLGASAYVLVQNDAEKDAARKIGVAQERVFDTRSIYLRRHLEDATGGEGMEVILATSGSENARAWECLADFGRFVEVRISDSHKATRPELSVNATFTSVNMASLAASRPQIMEQTMKAVIENVASGTMMPPTKASIFPASELARAIDKVRKGAIYPVVVIAGVNERVKCGAQATHQASETIFRRDGTHVIVGGTGGLGRSMAKYMVEHGARNVVLLSRSGGGEQMVGQLREEIGCPEAKILVKKCDASDENQVRQLVAECTKTLPPICGVVHAAMVLRDVLLESMSYEDYEPVIRPKVKGAWAMHNVLNKRAKLDYFVVLSSAAGILGSRGQGAYAAANTFLDSFVQYRVRNGLPATSLDLTAVTGAGYLAENVDRQEDIIRNFGNETVSEAEVLALLSAAVRGVCPPQCLTGMKLHMSSDGQWPYYASDPRFAGLKAQCIAEAEKEGLLPKNAISPGNAFRAAKSGEEAAIIAAQGILQKLSEVLTIPVQDLDVARNITSYGLDSLTAIELRNWIAKELRANLQILELLSSGSVNDLAVLIVQKTRAA